MPLTIAIGQKGRFKASKLEFEIVATAGPSSTIRYRNSTERYEITDDNLRPNADDIIGWGIAPDEKK